MSRASFALAASAASLDLPISSINFSLSSRSEAMGPSDSPAPALASWICFSKPSRCTSRYVALVPAACASSFALSIPSVSSFVLSSLFLIASSSDAILDDDAWASSFARVNISELAPSRAAMAAFALDSSASRSFFSLSREETFARACCTEAC